VVKKSCCRTNPLKGDQAPLLEPLELWAIGRIDDTSGSGNSRRKRKKNGSERRNVMKFLSGGDVIEEKKGGGCPSRAKLEEGTKSGANLLKREGLQALS